MPGPDDSPQPDLFAEDFYKPRVFRCLGGAFIGAFNREAVGDEEPAQRLSAFMPSVGAAEAALAAGEWPPVEPERTWVDSTARAAVERARRQ